MQDSYSVLDLSQTETAHPCPSAHVSYASCVPAPASYARPSSCPLTDRPGHLMDMSTPLTVSPPSASPPRLTVHCHPHHLAVSCPDAPAHLQHAQHPPASCMPNPQQ